MLSKALQKAAKLLDSTLRGVELGLPEFGDERYTAVPFDTANFHVLKADRPSGAMGFVDGGNREVLHAPDLSVQLVRVCSVLFRDGRRAAARQVPARSEFLCMARAFAESGRILYTAELLPIDPPKGAFLPDPAWLTIDSRDGQLAPGRFRADISVVGAAARRFAEWLALAELAASELEQGDILVRDGTLQTAVSQEALAASRAFSAAQDRGVLLTSLAKTSRLLTTSGMSLIAAVERLSRAHLAGKGGWYYHPIVKNEHPEHRAEIFACRLHPASQRVFRFEVLRDQARRMGAAELDRLFGQLAANSCDLSFPGYPYGLVDADEGARVRRDELETISALFSSALAEKGSWEHLKAHLGATDAHDVLDEI